MYVSNNTQLEIVPYIYNVLIITYIKIDETIIDAQSSHTIIYTMNRKYTSG